MTDAERKEVKGAAAFMRLTAEVLRALMEHDSRHEYAAKICAVAAHLACRAHALDRMVGRRND